MSQSETGNHDMTLNESGDESENTKNLSNDHIIIQSNRKKEDAVKRKPKKVSKSNKLKKEEVIDKTSILDLENQIKVLKSTIDLWLLIKPISWTLKIR